MFPAGAFHLGLKYLCPEQDVIKLLFGKNSGFPGKYAPLYPIKLSHTGHKKLLDEDEDEDEDE